MKPITFHPGSLLAGIGVAALALVTMGQKPTATEKWEHQIVVDVKDKDVAQLSEAGWTYVGYLGTSTRGAGSDETLWKRLKK